MQQVRPALALSIALPLALLAASGSAQTQPSTDSPYKVIKTAKVGGEGGSDYIHADIVGSK